MSFFNYDECSLEELIDVFIEIDDVHYTDRALLVLGQLAQKLNVEVNEVQLELIIAQPVKSSRWSWYVGKEYDLAEVYTEDAVTVRDKLIRLKNVK